MNAIQPVPNKYRWMPKYEKLLTNDDKLDIDFPFMGSTALNPLLGHNSGARSAMAEKQRNKTISIHNSEVSPVITGLEYEIGDYAERIFLPAGAEVKKIIRRESQGVYMDVTVLYYLNNVEDMVTVKDYGFQDTTFGYHMHTTKAFDNLKEGQSFKEDTTLSIGSSGRLGEFTYGINARIVNASHIECSKDAIVVSDTLLNSGRLDYSTFQTIEFGLSNKDVLYNVNGTIDEYIPLPKPGDKICKDGYIVGYFNNVNTLQLTREALTNKDNFVTGGTTYELSSQPENTIVKEVLVYKLGNVKKNALNTQLHNYWDDISYHNDSIVELLDNDNRKGSELHNLLKHIRALKNSKTYFNNNMPEWYVKIIVETIVRPTIKDKLVTGHGSKGLISFIEKEENMPYDSRGYRAEVIIDATSIERRMIPGNKYEGYLYDNVMWNSDKFLSRLDDGEKYEVVIKDVIEYLELWGNKDLINIYKQLKEEEVVDSIRDKGVRPVINIYDNNLTPANITRHIMNSDKFSTPLDGLWIPNAKGEDIWIQQPIATEVNRISVHYKNGETFQGTPTTYVNPLGGVVTPSKEIKKTKSYNISPLRAWSESEERTIKQTSPNMVKFLKKIRIMSSSPRAQSRLIKHILRKDYDGIEIPLDKEREIFKDSHDTSVSMLNGIYSAFGVRIDRENISYPIKPNNVLD